MAKLVKRGEKYSVRYVVPPRLRKIINTTQIWRTTGTGCLSEAKRREPRILATILDQVDREVALKAAAPADKGSVDWLLSIASGLSDSGMNTDDAAEIFSTHLDQHLQSRGIDPETTDLSPAHHSVLRDITKMASGAGKFVPLRVAFERYLNEKAGRITGSALDRKRLVLEMFAAFTGNRDVASVDRVLVGRFVSEVLLPNTTLSVASKKWYISALSAAWNWFERKGLVTTNPWKGAAVDVEGSKRGTEKLVKRPWTSDEIAVLRTLPANDPMRTVSVIRLYTGARIEEVCNLRVGDIDLEAGTINVREGKTQNSIRLLPVHPAILPVLRDLVENATDGWLYDMTPAGKDKRRGHNFNKAIGRWIRANVSADPALTSYTLRHSFASAMRNNGIDKETIEYCVGHRDQSLLFSTYATEVAVERLREAVSGLDFGFTEE